MDITRMSMTTYEMAQVVAQEFDTELPRFHAPLFLFVLLATLMEKVIRPLGIQPPLHRRRMDFFRKSFLFSQEKSMAILGFNPKITFHQGVTETAKWYSEMGYL